MAAAGPLLRPSRTATIFHGARGLPNAAEALADGPRNEAATVFAVGLPSTSSARFLRPHGEPGIIETSGQFGWWFWEAPAIPGKQGKQQKSCITHMRQMNSDASKIGLAHVHFYVYI